MTEHEFLATISILIREIDLLKYENSQLEKANDRLMDQIAKMDIEVKINAKPAHL